MKREQLYYYAYKYQGEYSKIKKAILAQEKWQYLNNEEDYFTILDDCYPSKLKSLSNPPYVLFYKGNIDLLNEDGCGVVGSRKAIGYAINYTKEICHNLRNEYVLISGLAEGIDTVVHKSAVLDGKTIAIVGCGLDYCYPQSNELLLQLLIAKQLVISEYPQGVKPLKHHFPMRNRIIAALSDFIVVTQASLRSGTFLTVNEALELGKAVYVLPYSLENKFGKGCNYLIQQGAEIILECHNFYKY